jgi:hypothetical protein
LKEDAAQLRAQLLTQLRAQKADQREQEALKLAAAPFTLALHTIAKQLQEPAIPQPPSAFQMRSQPHNAVWNYYAAVYKTYLIEHKKLPSNPTVMMVGGEEVKIGTWTARQKIRFNDGKLPQHQHVRLAAVPSWVVWTEKASNRTADQSFANNGSNKRQRKDK